MKKPKLKAAPADPPAEMTLPCPDCGGYIQTKLVGHVYNSSSGHPVAEGVHRELLPHDCQRK